MAVPELSPAMEERARAVHSEAFVFDAAVPMMGLYTDEQADIQALLDGGMGGISATIVTHAANFVKTVEAMCAYEKLIERNRDKLAACTTAAQLEQCKREGKVGMVAHFQDTKPIEDNLYYLRVFHALGLRVLQLTYNVQGYVGTGCAERHDAGLSVFGLNVVAECNRMGILIDISHCGHGTAWDALKYSKAPVAATHSGIYAMANSYGRNKPDDILKAVAESGGIVGIPLQSNFLRRDPKTYQVFQATLDDVLNQIDYAVNLMGVDHVGIGSDLSDYCARTLEIPEYSSVRRYRPLRPDVFGLGPTDRYDPFPVGIDSHAKMLNITRGLVSRGYSDENIKKILGGNWLRLFREVWGG